MQDQLAERAALVVHKVLLADALTELGRVSGASLVFSPSTVPLRLVSCACGEATIGEALDRLLVGAGMTYSVVGQHILVEPNPAFEPELQPIGTAAEPRVPEQGSDSMSAARVPRAGIAAGSIRGRVVDAGNRQALDAAQVVIEGVQIGMLTDESGSFVLTGVPVGTHVLRVSRIGYRSTRREVSIVAGVESSIDMDLSREVLSLDGVVVTGTPGRVERRAVGNVVEQIPVAEIVEAGQVLTVEQALNMRVPGVMLMPAPGSVGEDSAPLRIRGSSSVSLPNDPIFYMDGVRINSGRSFPRATGAVSRLNDINPADIESVEVIKGPAAATLYGTEASSGVVQIITRKGRVGPPAFDLSVEAGAMLPPVDQIPINYGLTPSGEVISHNLYEAEIERSGTEWYQRGPLRTYGLSVRGGADRLRYFGSVQRTDLEGVVDWNWERRTNGRITLSSQLGEQLALDVSTMYSSGTMRRPHGAWGAFVWGSPLTAEDAGGTASPRRGFWDRPLEADRDGHEEIVAADRVIWSVQLQHHPLRWLTNYLIAGTDLTWEERRETIVREPDAPFGFWGTEGLGASYVTSIESRFNTLDAASTLTAELGGGVKAATSVGFQYFGKRVERVDTEGGAFLLPGAGALTSAKEAIEENSSVGLYLQEQLDWRDRVYLTGAVRADDNSAFGAQFETAIYPKVSATWIVHEEPFWPDEIANQFRLRGAWGTAGRQPDSFAATRLYEAVPGPGEVSVATPVEYGNPELGPEIGEELELGFDAAFLQDRIQVALTRYWKTTRDAIVARELSPSLGFPGTQLINLGRTKNWGYEFSLQAQVLEHESVSGDIGVGFATMHNRIEDLGGVERIPIRRARHHVAGYPLASQFEYVILSAEFVSGDNGPVTNLMCDGGTGPDGLRPGGEPVPCSEAPLLYHGPSEPTWTVSLRPRLQLFGNLELGASIDAQGGNIVMADWINARHTTFANSLASVLQNDPIFMAYRQTRRQRLGFYDAGFARLREAFVRYVFERSWAQRFGADDATISIAARNVALLWREQEYTDIGHERVIDPEMNMGDQGFGGEATFVMPPTTSVLVSLRVTF